MDDYRGKKVLVTGGLGFIGSSVALRLVELGASVTIVDNLDATSGANYFNIEPARETV
jgi:nucleoside-diphosphate-sugar epimerase